MAFLKQTNIPKKFTIPQEHVGRRPYLAWEEGCTAEGLQLQVQRTDKCKGQTGMQYNCECKGQIGNVQWNPVDTFGTSE